MIHVSHASAAIALSVFSWGALAQGPMLLTPKPETPAATQDAAPRDVPSTSPLRLTPRKLQPLATETPSGTSQSTSRSIIQVEGLSKIDPNSVGNLSPENGGFGTDMWRGTPRALIERFLPQLSATIRSPVLRDLTRRLVLSSAEMPARGPQSGGKPTQSLIVSRILLLQSMGAFKDARDLTNLIPERAQDSRLLQLQAEDRLYANDYSNVCQIVDNAEEHLAKPYWQRLLVFCQTLRGDTEGAALGAGLLLESPDAADSAFIFLIDRLTHNTTDPLLSLRKPNALHLAAMRTAQVTIPNDAISTRNPAVLRTIGISPNARLETRLAAAEMAVEFGALSTKRLAEVYMAEKFDPTELNNALSLATDDRSPRGRALLFQAAQIESIDMAKAAIFSKAFEIATEENGYIRTIELYRPLLAELASAPEINWFAGEAARALYAVDRPLPARSWLEILQLAAAQNEEYKTISDGLWYLRYLTDSTVAEGEFTAGLNRWLTYHKLKSGARAQSRMAAGLRLLEALGHKVPDDAWWRVLEAPRAPVETGREAVLRTAMSRAADAGRVGEAVLLLLRSFDKAGPSIDDIDTMSTAVRVLRQLRLETEAKKLVLEIAATEGL
jgi:hypothetical protein